MFFAVIAGELVIPMRSSRFKKTETIDCYAGK